MTTTTELTNRAIAEALGHKVRTSDETGYPAYIGRGHFEDEWIEVDGQELTIPDYLGDANAALLLVKDTWFSFAKFSHLGGNEMMYTAEVEGYRVEADTLTEAICRAFMARQRAGEASSMARRVTISLGFEPRDLWVGVYWTLAEHGLDIYVCILPMLPIRFRYERGF
jgi:hypothetical protein